MKKIVATLLMSFVLFASCKSDKNGDDDIIMLLALYVLTQPVSRACGFSISTQAYNAPLTTAGTGSQTILYDTTLGIAPAAIIRATLGNNQTIIFTSTTTDQTANAPYLAPYSVATCPVGNLSSMTTSTGISLTTNTANSKILTTSGSGAGTFSIVNYFTFLSALPTDITVRIQ